MIRANQLKSLTPGGLGAKFLTDSYMLELPISDPTPATEIRFKL